MNCLKCGGTTKVVDRRGVRRKRVCDDCKLRFGTVEVAWQWPRRVLHLKRKVRLFELEQKK